MLGFPDAAQKVLLNYVALQFLSVYFAVSMFEVLLQSTPKDESKARDCHTLAPIKVLLDWLHTDPDSMSNPAFKTSSLVSDFWLS